MKPGTKVRLVGRDAPVGVVTDLNEGHVTVFWADGREELVRIDELEPAAPKTAALVTPAELLSELTARRLEHPLTDQLLSYRASRTKMFPHQFIPIRKLVTSPAQRVLVADEVGTGKTIEAGLVWAELDARRRGGLSSLLIVCPKALVAKWQGEFLHRFDLRLEHLDATSLKGALKTAKRDGVLSPRFSHAVVGLQLLRTGSYLEQMHEADLSWDLVVIDEAHHLRNPSTKSHAIGRFLGQRAEAMVLLTATPAQTSLDDLRSLYHILSVDVAEDAGAFSDELAHDMQLNDVIRLARLQPPGWQKEALDALRAVRRQRSEEATAFAEVESSLAQLSPGSAAELVKLRSLVRDLQALSPYTTRTLRADVDVNRPVREAVTRRIEFTPSQRALYDAVYAEALARAQEKGAPPGFVTQMPERRTASCPAAMARQLVEANDTPERLVHLARAVLEDEDPKTGALVDAIRNLLAEGHERLIVFSTFRATLAYLDEVLTAAGFTVQQVHGGTPQRDEDCRKGEVSREAIAAHFKAGKFQILLASEVASEGLDFQFCSALVNYDLPWNPMRVEQRIGRIDRIGQASPKVTVVNLSTPGTIEHRMLERLYMRLAIFERALGEMELVLGDEIDEFRRDLFSKRLTPEQQDERLDRIARAVEERRRQADQVAEEHGELLGAVERVEVEREEFKQMERKFLAPEHLEHFVVTSLRRKYGEDAVRPRTDDTFSVDLACLKGDLAELARALPATSSQRRAVRRLHDRAHKGTTRIRVQFVEPDYRGGAEFVHVRHPLVLLARRLDGRRSGTPPVAFGRIDALEGVDAAALVIGWGIVSHVGLLSQVELREEVLDETGAPVVLPGRLIASDLLSGAEPVEGAVLPPEIRKALDSLPASLARQGSEEVAELEARNKSAVDRGTRALRLATSGRRRWLKRQLSQPDLDANLRRMFESWEARLDRELEEKLSELQSRGAFHRTTEYIGAAVLEVARS